MGTGLLAVCDIAGFLLQDFGDAITLADQRHPAKGSRVKFMWFH
jgi:hypothetical protein